MRRAFKIASAVAIVLAGAGCRDGYKSFPDVPADAKPDEFVTEAKPLTLGSEKFVAEYGTIAVPENRSNVTSRLIHIPFLRIVSNAKAPAEPVFCLGGGPGQSNMSWALGLAWTLLPRHDVVLVGYRGVDGSTLLDCPEVAEAFKAESDMLSEESMKAIGSAWTASAERLRARGVDLDGYTMLETIEDNESVRKVLGYERIHLLSASYGTRIAYLYGLKHPERIFRSAMISVNPPGHFVWEPQVIDSQLRYYAALWSKDSATSAKTPDLYGTMATVLNAMPRRWLFLPINSGKVKIVTFALLYHRSTAAMVFDAYVAAGRGDPSGLALMSLAYDYVVPSLMVWGDAASKAVGADFDSTRNYGADMEPPGLPLGSPMSKVMWGSLRYCRWPIRQLPAEYRSVQHSGVETLLLSGSIDFSTPAEFATKELLPYLKNGKQVILSEAGHVNDLLYVSPENSKLILTSFFETGVPNVSLNAYVPMDFNVSWRFSTLAKLALAAIILVVLAACFVIFRLIRRYGRGSTAVREAGPVSGS